MTPEAKTLNAIPVEDIGTVVIDSESIERFIEAAVQIAPIPEH
jgi:hypothetical protein